MAKSLIAERFDANGSILRKANFQYAYIFTRKAENRTGLFSGVRDVDK